MTLNTRLLQYKNLFYEHGMMAVWNELRKLSNSAREDADLAVLDIYGTTDLAVNCDPDVPTDVHNTRAVGHASFLSQRNGGEPPTPAVP